MQLSNHDLQPELNKNGRKLGKASISWDIKQFELYIEIHTSKTPKAGYGIDSPHPEVSQVGADPHPSLLAAVVGLTRLKEPLRIRAEKREEAASADRKCHTPATAASAATEAYCRPGKNALAVFSGPGHWRNVRVRLQNALAVLSKVAKIAQGASTKRLVNAYVRHLCSSYVYGNESLALRIIQKYT